jgi:hypothetical protein
MPLPTTHPYYNAGPFTQFSELESNTTHIATISTVFPCGNTHPDFGGWSGSQMYITTAELMRTFNTKYPYKPPGSLWAISFESDKALKDELAATKAKLESVQKELEDTKTQLERSQNELSKKSDPSPATTLSVVVGAVLLAAFSSNILKQQQSPYEAISATDQLQLPSVD